MFKQLFLLRVKNFPTRTVAVGWRVSLLSKFNKHSYIDIRLINLHTIQKSQKELIPYQQIIFNILLKENQKRFLIRQYSACQAALCNAWEAFLFVESKILQILPSASS